MLYSFIHINERPCYARDRDGITVEVYEVRVGDADPIYMDRIGRTHCSSLCFNTIKELENFYSTSMWRGYIHD